MEGLTGHKKAVSTQPHILRYQPVTHRPPEAKKILYALGLYQLYFGHQARQQIFDTRFERQR